jgi:large subunit ribosomal protein L29
MAKGDNQMAAKELRQRGDAELRSLLSQKHEELQKAQFKNALGQLRQTHNLKVLKRDIARVETVLNEREKAPKAGTQAEG